MPSSGRVAIGSLAGAIVAGILAPLIRGFFSVPGGGVGWVTVNQYPKGWDYAVVALIVVLSAIGGVLAAPDVDSRPENPTISRRVVWAAAFVVFVLMVFAHEHPYQLMDPFHEGEHLTPAFQLKTGQKAFSEIFLLHGLAADGGLDALVLGDPPSPQRARRLQSVLDAITLAMLVPIAAEVSATAAGMAFGAFASLCALAAFMLSKTPYFRMLPLLIAVLAMLRFVRTRKSANLWVAAIASAGGVLWSLDFGIYALAATGICAFVLAPRKAVAIIPIACVAPLAFVAVIGGSVPAFLRDSFVIIPSAIDAVWSLPAPKALEMASVRYYVPLALYGGLLALAFRMRRSDPARAAQLFVLTTFSLLLFRTAAGRVSWVHTRYALPLFGVIVVAFVIEPLLRSRRRVAGITVALLLTVFVEVVPNLSLGGPLIAGWRARRSHDGLVRYPFATGKGLYTTAEDARDLAALNGFAEKFGADATFFNFSGERSLHYFLQRKPPTRCSDVNMLSAPPLLREAMQQLEANPPAFVVVSGVQAIQSFDGVPPETRVPQLAKWIDERYPNRVTIGRFVVATR